MGHVEAMLSVKGVDMVQFGPVDYSMSIGIPRHGPPLLACSFPRALALADLFADLRMNAPLTFSKQRNMLAICKYQFRGPRC